MKFYFAPLMGVTGYVYRNAHNEIFHSIDKYYTPFISPNQKGMVKQKDFADVLPENNKGTVIVPQILTNDAEQFIYTSNQLKEFGYTEVNLNIGCPSETVVSKGRGAGFLAQKEELNHFLDKIFTAGVTDISVKTRVGLKSHDEIYGLMEIFNQYPMKELIIHPRVREDFYKNTANQEIFADVYHLSKNPVCHNGDIFTVQDYERVMKLCPEINCMMIGRGLLHNPGLINEIMSNEIIDKKVLRRFHDLIYYKFHEVLDGPHFVLIKMKQFWFYVAHLLDETEVLWNRIKGCAGLEEYNQLIGEYI